MSVFFNTVQIRNFKSLKDATLHDCKRINVLIGKPNVGKSNILEAIGLFSLPYIKYSKSKKITQFVKLENLTEMFFDGDIEKSIEINADNESSIIAKFEKNLPDQLRVKIIDCYISAGEERELSEVSKSALEEADHFFSAIDKKITQDLIVEQDLNIKEIEKIIGISRVKAFRFPTAFIFGKSIVSHLIPPDGSNLFEVAQTAKLKKDLTNIFQEYRLKLLFDKTSNTLRIIKELDDNSLISLPFSSMADTLQRVVFFKAAIASNTNSILLFEEPEAHCFPPYIAHITQEVIAAESNQFFIATHSPYVLNDFLERKIDELAVFFIDYQDGQTVINRLTDAELNEVYDYGIDVFFNYERFTRHE